MSVCNYNMDSIQGCYICNQNLNITKWNVVVVYYAMYVY